MKINKKIRLIKLTEKLNTEKIEDQSNIGRNEIGLIKFFDTVLMCRSPLNLKKKWKIKLNLVGY